MRLGGDAALGFEFCQRDAGLAKPRGGVHFCFAQRRKTRAGFDPLFLAQCIFAGEVFHLAPEHIQLRPRRFRGQARLHPAQVGHERVKRLDFVGQLAIPPRLGRLSLQAGELAFHFSRDFRKPLEVCFGPVELQFGLMPATVQPRDTGGFLKDPAAVLWFGADQFRDLSLPDQGGGVGASGGVGEKQLDVLAAHRASVDAVAGARAAAQPALDLKLVCAVELRRRCPLRVVEYEDDLGSLPGRPSVCAVEDQVVHLAAAHGLGRVGAHRPAQGFQQVGLATPVGADDAGQARLDRHSLRVYERLEAGNAKLSDLHAGASSLLNALLGEQGVNLLRETFGRAEVALEIAHLAIENERRRAIDAELFPRLVHGRQLVAVFRVFEAGIKRFVGFDPVAFGDSFQHAAERADIGRLNDAFLVLEEIVQNVKIPVLAGAERNHIRRHIGLAVDREFAEHELHLASGHVFLFESRKDFVVEILARRAGGRGVFDQGDRRIGVAFDMAELARNGCGWGACAGLRGR